MILEAKLKTGASAPFFMKYTSAFLIALFTGLLFSCSSGPKYQIIRLQGEAQGTTFQITVLSDTEMDLERPVDSILRAVDRSMSPWLPTSLISRINQGDTSVRVDPMFEVVFRKSQELNSISKGYFDITVGGLANAWGFGPNGPMELDSARVDSLMQYVGMDRVRIQGQKVYLEKEGIRFDFNAIAQGYSVDLICAYLDGLSVQNYLVEIGGELRSKGKNLEEKTWRIGIDKPTAQRASDPFQAIIELPNKALATSGNYRKFRTDEVTGKKYVHTINPLTGYTAQQNLLSATIVAQEAMVADGYSTMCMAMGLKKSIQLIEADSTLEGMLVYSKANGDWAVYQSAGFEKLVR